MIVAVIVILGMIALALWANARLKDHARLPMQWSLGGKVNWTAPRPFALAFFPGLAIVVLVALMIFSNYATPRAGQEREAAYAIPFVMILLLVIQCAHLLMADRTFRAR